MLIFTLATSMPDCKRESKGSQLYCLEERAGCSYSQAVQAKLGSGAGNADIAHV